MADGEEFDFGVEPNTETRYCWPIVSLDELRTASLTLRSRVIDRSTDPDLESASVAIAVDRRLETALSDSTACPIALDETGHVVRFVHLLTPLPRDRCKRLALREDAANGKPLLVAVLMPEMAFNLSEVESAYDFDIHSIVEQLFGPDTAGHLIIHQGSTYLSKEATFSVLSHEHPALLISLAHVVAFGQDHRTNQVREILSGMRDALSYVEMSIREQTLCEPFTTSPHDFHQTIVTIFEEAQHTIPNVIAPEGSEEESTWYLRHQIAECFATLLTDERMSFDRLWGRITKHFESPQIEAMDELPAIPLSQITREDILEAFQMQIRAVRCVRQRLHRIRCAVIS